MRLIVSTALNNPAGIEFGQPSCRDIGKGFIDISLERRKYPFADPLLVTSALLLLVTMVACISIKQQSL